jgi:hypothetical protein
MTMTEITGAIQDIDHGIMAVNPSANAEGFLLECYLALNLSDL